MFSLGLYEIIVIAIMAIIIIKPEDLPSLFEKLGSLYGKAKSHINSIKAEFTDSVSDIKDMKTDIDNSIQKAFDFEEELEKLSENFDDIKVHELIEIKKHKTPSLNIGEDFSVEEDIIESVEIEASNPSIKTEENLISTEKKEDENENKSS